jgi:ribonuclease-3
VATKEQTWIQTTQDRLHLKFRDPNFLLQALTHRSMLHDEPSPAGHNERLEFLGDAVLSLVAAQSLFAQSATADEGMLTQQRAAYVCEASLAQGARRLGLGELLRASKTMRTSGSVELPSVLADALEALFGAIYLDQGFDAAKDFILKALGPLPTEVVSLPKDPKTELQELIQSAAFLAPAYRVAGQTGPAHAPIFRVEVIAGDRVLAEGAGPSKKEAAQEAAREVLKVIQSMKPAQISAWLQNAS